ncbi:MAG: TlpA family protein disulfide reductase [Acidobacteria bacterium]|nr:TlpA family protein disulfide reductase [Acidobacteriota bacterium]
MENNEWVEEKMAILQADDGFAPDAAAGLQRLRCARSSRRMGWVWAAGGGAVACAGLLAFPATRVLAQRCVEACVAETAAVGQMLGFGPAAPVEARAVAPDFALTDAEGKMLRLADLRGKVVLVNFWATWCPPCRTEIPLFAELQKAYGDAGFAVVGVSMDEGWDAVRPAMSALGVNYPVVLGDDETARKFGGVEKLPETYLIDRSGRIAAAHAGLPERRALEERIRGLLGEGR